MLEFRLLGPLEVHEGGRLVPLPRPKQRALLAILLLRAGQIVSTDQLIAGLWGERPPKKALTALQNNVSQLRKVLGSGVLATRAPGYVLHVDPDQVDALRFERLVAEAREASAAERAATLRDALSLFRDTPLADLTSEPFAEAEILRLEDLQLRAREELIAAELELGLDADLIPDLEALVSGHPYRERLHARLMLALYRAGRQADALAAYQTARRALDEVGLEPGDELQELQRAILRQDAALRGSPGVSSTEAPATLEHPVAPRGRRAGRRTVTVVFAELVPADTARHSDPESLRALLDRYHDAADVALERHGGTIEPLSGSVARAVFGLPTTHEDDALRAVRAALDLRTAVESIGLSARTALCTGEVFISGASGEPLATGEAFSLAEKLCSASSPGDIVLSAETHALVRDAVETEPLAAGQRPATHRLVLLLPEAGTRPLRLDSPLVGRERQLKSLSSAFTSAVADRTCHLFTILGLPGVGKSRLAQEFVLGLGDTARVLRGRCLPYGEAVALSPLFEALGDGAGVGDDPGSLRAVLERLAHERPLTVLLDDLQWAEPPLLDFVEQMAEQSREAPILLVCLARPELHEQRPAWGGGKPNATSILLEPLSPAESERLVDNLLGESDLPQPVRAHIVGGADGNPLFIEELLAMLVDQAVLRHDGERWTTQELPVLAIPPTVQALIAARIDRLGDDERTILELASVEGKLFGVRRSSGWHRLIFGAALTSDSRHSSAGS